MAAFGGYPDNFNFPRYGFDVGFVRLYENDKPVETPDALPWADTPAEGGRPDLRRREPRGHRAGADRRAARLPARRVAARTMVRLSELRGTLLQFTQGNPDLWRVTRARIRTVENGLKALTGRQAYLADPATFERKRAEDAAAALGGAGRSGQGGAVRRRPGTAIARAMDAERRALARHAPRGGRERGLRLGPVRGGHGSWCARRRSGPSRRPSGCGSSPMPGCPRRASTCSATVPVSRPLERTTLTVGLRRLRDTLGPGRPLRAGGAGRAVRRRSAEEAVDGTHLDEAEGSRCAVGGRAGRRRRVDRPDDRPRPTSRPRGPGDPQASARTRWKACWPGTASCSTRRTSRCTARRLSRRHLHPPALLRNDRPAGGGREARCRR